MVSVVNMFFFANAQSFGFDKKELQAGHQSKEMDDMEIHLDMMRTMTR